MFLWTNRSVSFLTFLICLMRSKKKKFGKMRTTKQNATNTTILKKNFFFSIDLISTNQKQKNKPNGIFFKHHLSLKS